MLTIGVNVGEDAFGNLFYNMNRDPQALLERKKAPVAPREEAWGPEPGNNVSDDAGQVNIDLRPAGRAFDQASRPAGPRGSVSFMADGARVIRLFEGANLSTLLHEGAYMVSAGCC